MKKNDSIWGGEGFLGSVRTHENGDTDTFDAQGRLVNQTRPTGTYDANGNSVSTTRLPGLGINNEK
jgi:YD repeat-containing protein